jgi:hypothetical protein
MPGGAGSHEDADAIAPVAPCGRLDRLEETVLREAQLGGAVVAAIEAREVRGHALRSTPGNLAHEGGEVDGLEAARGEPAAAVAHRGARGLEAVAEAARHRV